MSKSVDLSLDEIVDAIEEAGYQGFLLYTDPETYKAMFSIKGGGETIAVSLYEVFKQDPNFFKLVATSIFAYASINKEMFPELEILYKLSSVMVNK